MKQARSRDPVPLVVYSAHWPSSGASLRSLLRCYPSHTRRVKSAVRLTSGLLLFAPFLLSAQTSFTSLYIFGDGLSTTTNNPGAGPLFYGQRYSNGRIWAEVLAQWQGLTFVSNRNWSYFGQFSSNLLGNLAAFSPSSDTDEALFVVWVNNADFVDDMNKFGDPNNAFHGTNITSWTNAINSSLSNHFRIITNLYGKGARTLLMPNAVDIMKVPNYDPWPAGNKSFVRQQVVNFNVAFSDVLSNAAASLPDLTIFTPDIFALADDVIAHPANYGLRDAFYNGFRTDAVEDPALTNKALNGPGTNYMFWDYMHPTAKFHMVIADTVQRVISPVQFSGIAALAGSNRLDAINVPVGRAGFLDATTNFVNWESVQNVNTNFATQSLYVPASDPLQFYRLRFPFAWSWP